LGGRVGERAGAAFREAELKQEEPHGTVNRPLSKFGIRSLFVYQRRIAAMKSLLPILLGALLLVSAAAQADEATPANTQASPQGGDQQGCGLASGALVSQDQGQVTINCVGVTEEYGAQLAGILTYVLQRRLDPELVIAKLDEVEGVPPGDTPRNLTVTQGQAIVQGLIGMKPATIKIVADPDGPEPGDYALAIATRLGMAGWQIEGNQITRSVPAGLEDIHGIVLVVHDEKAPPEKAIDFKKALGAAKIFLPVISRPVLAPDAVMLWVGKRPTLNAAAAQ
jgi:hypothetical protein